MEQDYNEGETTLSPPPHALRYNPVKSNQSKVSSRCRKKKPYTAGLKQAFLAYRTRIKIPAKVTPGKGYPKIRLKEVGSIFVVAGRSLILMNL